MAPVQPGFNSVHCPGLFFIYFLDPFTLRPDPGRPGGLKGGILEGVGVQKSGAKQKNF